jgi:hypothetical protein
VAGSVPAFTKLMNAKARALGARNTNFVNPHGLHDPQHYSTAYDLALIARAALNHKQFNQIVRTHQTTIHGNWKQGPVRPLINRNRLMLRWNACDGIKTGYTRQAGNCLVASATQRDSSGKPWRLLAVALNSFDTWNDCYNLLQKQGFEQFQPHTVAATGEIAGEIHAEGGAATGQAVVQREVRVPVKTHAQSTLTRRVRLSKVHAPVRQGQIVGNLEILAEGQPVSIVPLVAKETVPLSTFARVMPNAAPILPADPQRRLLGYVLLLGAASLILCAFKARSQKPNSGRRAQPRLDDFAAREAALDSLSLADASLADAAATQRASKPSGKVSVASGRAQTSSQNSYETPQQFSQTHLETRETRAAQSKLAANSSRSARNTSAHSAATRSRTHNGTPNSVRSADRPASGAARSTNPRPGTPRGVTPPTAESRHGAAQHDATRSATARRTTQRQAQTGSRSNARPDTGSGARRSQNR